MAKSKREEQYEATLRDPVAFHKDGDVFRNPHFLVLSAMNRTIFYE